MTSPSKKYNTPESFRQALETRLRQTWKEKGGDYQDHTRIGDYFTWQVRLGAKELPNAEAGGTRLTVISMIDGRNFREFHVDVELKEREILPPERQAGRDILSFAGVPNPTYSITPNELIWSEKLAAYIHPWNDRHNTRVKDIVDLNLLIDQGLDEEKICQAMEKVFDSIQLPKALQPPPEPWNKTYPILAQQAGLELTLDQAYNKLNDYYKNIMRKTLNG
jgi:Nucleotidyl transferase AbiEii toxin, Type IV TA system